MSEFEKTSEHSPKENKPREKGASQPLAENTASSISQEKEVDNEVIDRLKAKLMSVLLSGYIQDFSRWLDGVTPLPDTYKNEVLEQVLLLPEVQDQVKNVFTISVDEALLEPNSGTGSIAWLLPFGESTFPGKDAWFAEPDMADKLNSLYVKALHEQVSHSGEVQGVDKDWLRRFKDVFKLSLKDDEEAFMKSHATRVHSEKKKSPSSLRRLMDRFFK